MENSSRSQTLQDSPIVFPPNAFWWPWTILLLLAVVVVLFVTMIAIVIAWAVWQHLDAQATIRAMNGLPATFIQGIAEVLTVAFIVLLLPWLAKTPFSGIGFRKISWAQLRVIFVGAVAMFLIVTPLTSVLQSLLHFKTPEAAVAIFAHATGWQKAVFALFGVLLAPAFEEALFRLTLFNALRHWWGLWPGAIISSLLFGVAHAQPPFTPVMFASIAIPLAAGGLVLCLVYAKTNNAWASYITHGAFNGFTLILLVLFPQLAK